MLASLVRHQQALRACSKKIVRDATEHPFPRATMTVGSSDDQVCSLIKGERAKLTGRSRGQSLRTILSLYPMPPEPGDHIGDAGMSSICFFPGLDNRSDQHLLGRSASGSASWIARRASRLSFQPTTMVLDWNRGGKFSGTTITGLPARITRPPRSRCEFGSGGGWTSCVR